MLIRDKAEIYMLIGTFHRHFDLSQIEGNIWDRSQKFCTGPKSGDRSQIFGTIFPKCGTVSQRIWDTCQMEGTGHKYVGSKYFNPINSYRCNDKGE